MTIQAILHDLEAKDIKLQVQSGRLLVDAPKGIMTAELQQAIRDHKDELIALLSKQNVDYDKPAIDAKACCLAGCLSPRGPVGVFCQSHAPAPLPTLIKRLPGYKCPACVYALHELPDGQVGCSGGHVFERE